MSPSPRRLALIAPYSRLAVVPSLIALMEALVRHGYGLDLYTWHDWEDPPPLAPLEDVRLFLLPQTVRQGQGAWRWQFFGRWLPFLWRQLGRERNCGVLGVDHWGLLLANLAARLKRIPVIYLSLELYFRDEMSSPYLMMLKRAERWCSRSAALTLIQDEDRAALLMAENGIGPERLALLPNGWWESPGAGKTADLRRTLGLEAARIIVLYAGSISEWTQTLELAQAARTWPENWAMVFHAPGSLESPYERAFLRQIDGVHTHLLQAAAGPATAFGDDPGGGYRDSLAPGPGSGEKYLYPGLVVGEDRPLSPLRFAHRDHRVADGEEICGALWLRHLRGSGDRGAGGHSRHPAGLCSIFCERPHLLPGEICLARPSGGHVPASDQDHWLNLHRLPYKNYKNHGKGMPEQFATQRPGSRRESRIPGVVVSNGSQRFYMYQTALVCQQAGRLRHLIAGWVPKNRLIDQILQSAAFSRVFGDQMAKRVRARRPAGIDPDRLVSLLLPDFIERLDRSGAGRSCRSGLFSFYSMQAFGWLSQRYVTQGDLFHVRSGYGRFAMARARRSGAVCLVDHSIADPRFIREIMVAEAARWGLPYDFPDLHWRCVSQDIDEADHILANSDFVRDTLVACRGIPPEKVAVLPWSVDLNRFAPAAEKRDNDKFRILFVGEVGLRKGVLYLLEAFKKLNLPNAELVLVGGVTEIETILASKDFEFRHIPVLPQEDLVAFYQGAAIFVFPSLIEGSARVVQEAMACGLPIITTPNSGSVVQDSVEGYVVPVCDSEALAERILELYKDPQKSREMGLAARATAERRFAPQVYGEGLLALHNSLLQRS